MAMASTGPASGPASASPPATTQTGPPEGSRSPRHNWPPCPSKATTGRRLKLHPHSSTLVPALEAALAVDGSYALALALLLTAAEVCATSLIFPLWIGTVSILVLLRRPSGFTKQA